MFQPVGACSPAPDVGQGGFEPGDVRAVIGVMRSCIGQPLLVERRLLHQSVPQFADFGGTTDCMVARIEHLELEGCAFLKCNAKLLLQPKFGSFASRALEQIFVAHDCDTTKLVP